MSYISVQNIFLSHMNKRQYLKILALQVEPGQFVVTGENGAQSQHSLKIFLGLPTFQDKKTK